MTPAELATLGRNERRTWDRIVRLAHIKAD